MRTKLLTTANDKEIVTLEEAMEHSHLTDSYDELEVQGCLDAAHDLVQQWLNRKFYVSTFAGYVEKYRPRFTLPFPPIISVASVHCEDKDGVEYELVVDDDWKYDTITDTIRFMTDFSGYTNFTFYYTAGYSDLDCIPKAVKHAIKMTFATLYENREDSIVGTQINEVPLTARRILSSHRVRSQT